MIREKWSNKLAAVATRLGQRPYFQEIFRELDRQTAIRASRREDGKNSLLAVGLTWAVLIGICSFFYFNIAKYLEWPPAAYSNPKVLNLTQTKVEWQTYYGEPVRGCGELDCHLTQAYPADKFTNHQILPVHEFPLANFRKGQSIYYRAKVRLPAYLFEAKERLFFHSVYVWADRYEFYVNDRLVDIGGAQLLNIPLPLNQVAPDSEITLAFKITADNQTYQGLAHYGELVIGPRSLLEPLSYTAREIKTNYFLWHLLPRLTICLVFCFLFLSMAKNRENFTFFLFILSSSLKVFVATAYAEDLLPRGLSGETLSEVLNAYEAVFFILFVYHYFRRYNPKFKTVYTSLCAAVSLALVVFFKFLPSQQHVEAVRTLVRALHFGGGVYALYLGATTTLYLAHNQKSRMRLRTSLVLSGFLFLSLGFLAAQYLDVLPERLVSTALFTNELILCLVLAGLVAMEFGSTVVQRDTIKTKLRQVVDPQIADKLLADQSIMNGQNREVTILFADIRSFTTLSETYPASVIVELLNAYFDVMVEIIGRHGGVVDKLIGDAIMAVWGAPLTQEQDAENAVRCAIAMRKGLAEFNARRREAGQFCISIGIGLHTGSVVAGGVGSRQRMDYTVIGDTVNTAARIENQTKIVKSDILLSEDTFAKVRDLAVVAPCGSQVLRGKASEIAMFRLIGIIEADVGFVCNDPFYDGLPPPSRAGVIDCEIENLQSFVYPTAEPSRAKGAA